MHRFSAFDFAIYLDLKKLPNREQWQSVVDTKKLPLILDSEFDPHKHPVCETTQVAHPEGQVIATVGGAECRFQLDIYDQLDLSNFRIEAQREALQACNGSFAFRWDAARVADTLGAYLSAATLALAADGVVLWGRNRDETRMAADAFKVLNAKAWTAVKRPGHKTSRQDPFGPPMIAQVIDQLQGRFECPKCGLPFSVDTDDNRFFDGKRHVSCGHQLIIPDRDQINQNAPITPKVGPTPIQETPDANRPSPSSLRSLWQRLNGRSPKK